MINSGEGKVKGERGELESQFRTDDAPAWSGEIFRRLWEYYQPINFLFYPTSCS
jgi:hypothetical protein